MFQQWRVIHKAIMTGISPAVMAFNWWMLVVCTVKWVVFVLFLELPITVWCFLIYWVIEDPASPYYRGKS